MKAEFVIRSQALAELDGHARYIARHSPAAAKRFLTAVRDTFEVIADRPRLGAIWDSPDPRLQGVRRRIIKGFRNYLVFYRVSEDEITVLHVFHGAQDIASRLADEDVEE